MALPVVPEVILKIRTPPVDARFALHLPKKSGKCRWCGLPIDELTMFGKKRLLWHRACELEFQIITMPDVARTELFKRDKGICASCGEDWSDRYRFAKGAECMHGFDRDEQGFYRSTEVLWISLWHNDHIVPLWKVVHMPPLKRLAYFTLANMQTLCTPCHQQKCSDEAAEKAKYDRRERAKTETAKPKRAFGSRPMRSDFKPRVKDINDN